MFKVFAQGRKINWKNKEKKSKSTRRDGKQWYWYICLES
jgi:hypothetical protein